MAGYVLVGMLAAFGVFCALWAVFGWLLPGLTGCVLVCPGPVEEEIFTKYKWLKDAGILDCPLLVVTESGEPAANVEICSWEDLRFRLEMERKRFDGTGNGDHPGRHQRRGISEL